MSGRFHVRLEMEGEDADTAVAIANDGGKLLVKKSDGTSYEVVDIATVPYGSDIAVDGRDLSLLSQRGDVLTTVQTQDTIYDLPIATTTILGGIKPDGTTITVNSATGVATAVGGGGGGMENPMTATGDLIVGANGGVPTRLAMGSAGQVLRVNGDGDGMAWGAGEDGSSARDMPSNSSISLTVGASGTSFTAPTNGWVNITASTSSSNGWVTITVNGGTHGAGVMSYSTGKTIYLLCPVKVADVFVITYTNVTISVFKFIHSVGAEPPQQPEPEE
jgi:hypothetical protein